MIRPRKTLMVSQSSRIPVGKGNERIGAVQYLNTRPLIYGLGDSLDFDLPSKLADRLAVDELDVALIPSIELYNWQNIFLLNYFFCFNMLFLHLRTR